MLLELSYLLIILLADWRFTILVSLAAGLVMALLWVRKSKQASSTAGIIAFAVVFVLLGGVNILLNAPLGPPLDPTALSLPADYTGFWMVVGSVFAFVGFSIMVLLWRILQTLVDIARLLERGQP